LPGRLAVFTRSHAEIWYFHTFSATKSSKEYATQFDDIGGAVTNGPWQVAVNAWLE
jgi:hypothetical protein